MWGEYLWFNANSLGQDESVHESLERNELLITGVLRIPFHIAGGKKHCLVWGILQTVVGKDHHLHVVAGPHG